MAFLNDTHKQRYEELLKRGRMQGDTEREIAMYIIAGNDALYSKVNKLYDFKDKSFKFDLKENEEGNMEIWWKASLSSSEEKLMLLAYDLFSNRSNIGVVELFRVLDTNNKRLAFNAISLAYNQ